jgi:hypothetical protein
MMAKRTVNNLVVVSNLHCGCRLGLCPQGGAQLNAVPEEAGRHPRWEVWIRLGRGLVHATHHIGTTGSQACESTAVMRELAEASGFSERTLARWLRSAIKAGKARQIGVRPSPSRAVVYALSAEVAA